MTYVHDVQRALAEIHVLDDARQIAEEHCVPLTLALSRHRDRSATAARHAICRMLRMLGLSYPAVGRIMGLDHTTVMNACRSSDDVGLVRPIQICKCGAAYVGEHRCETSVAVRDEQPKASPVPSRVCVGCGAPVPAARSPAARYCEPGCAARTRIARAVASEMAVRGGR